MRPRVGRSLEVSLCAAVENCEGGAGAVGGILEDHLVRSKRGKRRETPWMGFTTKIAERLMREKSASVRSMRRA